MKVLVVYESIFGNTKQVAEAIGGGLAEHFDVEVLEVSNAPIDVAEFNLIVAGGPTQAWGMSRSSTRKGARDQAVQMGKSPVSESIGVRDWLGKLSRTKVGLAAAFDTAIRRTGVFPYGSAAKGAASNLQKKGYRLIAEPQQFFVKDTAGPLDEGEAERARQWGKELASKLGG